MTEILCQWLNEELGLSRRVEPSTFAKEFSTGYLIGEILNKHQLQDDFDQFSQSRNTLSQLNNFQRLLPTLQLLGVMVNDRVVQALVEEQRGVATRLLYQIYIALRRKQTAQLSKLALETMRPPAAAKLANISTQMYKERLKTMIPREVDVILENVSEHFVTMGKEIEEQASHRREEELQQQKIIREEQRMQNLERFHKAKMKNGELMAKIQASILPVSKEVSRAAGRANQKRKQELRRKEAEMFVKEIKEFETILKKLGPPGGEKETDSGPHMLQEPPRSVETFVPCGRVEEGPTFIKIIRKRLEEDAQARKEREKRRCRAMLDQLEAHEAQEEVYREEQLVNRLMRQSQQERRIAVQLMHARHEKQVIVQNRIFREKQYEEKRLQEFQEELDYLAVLARQEKLEHAEQTQRERELHERIMAERAEERFRKHYNTCWEVVGHIVDLAAKVGEYRELTLNLIPNQIMREWKELFLSELPIYEQPVADPQPSQLLSMDSVELAKHQLLNAQDYEDYKEMTGEWQPPEEGDIHGPPPNNNILGHVVHRIFEIVNPTAPPTPPPVFPPFPIKACILGKLLAGKSTCLKHLAEALHVRVLSPDTLVREAVQAFDEGETVDPDETQEDKTETGKENQVLDVGSSVPAGSGAMRVDASEGQDIPKGPIPTSNKDQLRDLSKNTSKGRLSDLIEQGSQGRKSLDEPEIAPQEEVKEGTQSQTSKTSNKEAQPSARAQLGERAAKWLRTGKSVPDGLLVEIVVEFVRCLPAQCGWILDGFPVDINQAKLLEKGLTGVDPDKAVTKSKRSKTKFVLDPTAPKDPPPPQPALDIAILLDVSDSTVLARRSESTAASSGTEIEIQKTPNLHQETEGNLAPTVGSSHEEEQLLPRLAGFLDNWPELEKWFQAQQNILVKVNGELEQDELLEKLEIVLVEAMFKKQSKDAVPEKPAEVELLPLPTQVVSSPSPESQVKSPKDERPARGSVSLPSSDSVKRKLSKSPRDRKQDRTSSVTKSGSAKSKKGKDGKGKLERLSPEPLTEPEPPRPPPPKPGSDEWVYVDELIPQEIAEYLAPYWSNIVDTYINTIHSVMQEQRSELHRIINYLHSIREDFLEYLESRPDHKQEFVSQWQADYNSIPEDLRKDDDMKAELLLRLYTLRERLWDISDNRKEEAERERMNLIGNGWLEDHLGVLINLYTTLIQMEVDRFQDTLRFLQDYYKGMEGKIPPEENKDFARLPLVSVPDVELHASAPTIDQDTGSAPDSSQPDRQSEPDPSSPATDSKEEQNGDRQGDGKTKVYNAPDSSQPDGQSEPDTSSPATDGKEEQNGDRQGDGKTKVYNIPLVSYRIPSSSLALKDKGKVPVKVKGKEEVVVVETLPLPDVDEYLIFDAYQSAVSTLSNLIQREVKIKEDEEKEQKLKEDKEKETQKSSSGKDGKKKSAKSASKKKGLQTITPTVPPAEIENPEVIKRRELRERIYTEYFGALEDELLAVRARLELIKLKAMTVIEDLKSKAKEVFTIMEDGLGTRFLQEMESISALLDIGLEHVDTATKIEHQLVLRGTEFFINGDVKMIADPEPITRLPSKEIPKEGVLTIEQLRNLHRQFMLVAPTGLMMRKTFIEILQDLVTLDLGSAQLPEPWCSISYSQVLDITTSLTPDSDILDWRRFLLPAAQPWPYPSLSELLDTKSRFQAIDQAGTGYVTEEQYNEVGLWFKGETELQVPEDPVEPLPFERLSKLEQVFFTMFADASRMPPELDYNRLLLYFAAHPDPAQGFHRALSLATGTLLPWKPASSSSNLVKSQPCIHQVSAKGTPVPEELQVMSPPSAEKVPLSALFQIMAHGVTSSEDTYHSSQPEEEQHYCKHLTQVYKELGSKDLEPVPLEILQRHPVIMDLIKSIVKFYLPDFQAILQKKPVESEVIASSSPELSVETSSNTPTEDTGTSRRRIPKI